MPALIEFDPETLEHWTCGWRQALAWLLLRRSVSLDHPCVDVSCAEQRGHRSAGGACAHDDDTRSAHLLLVSADRRARVRLASLRGARGLIRGQSRGCSPEQIGEPSVGIDITLRDQHHLPRGIVVLEGG